ncbi:UDP-N-acetylglucosamine 2-epimerase (non-hydrolyzing) [Sulfurihydrogenibium sp.]|jgi:UDP-N-acetylglucosamine 2-epimerase (non-hydrolysing)|uniref:non-hydrolyzing UDP-N-acetylglucosamine 2-epimerase n=1 Tax=Sulfurihydrogenibium sp. TaxID=2053621 RepID=UPI00260B6F20|nr:UDP-N-acetylglucosamine 2-epimerase (non-hydrolyzing) [Sulfurihydrogenibium sp.]
MKKSLFIFGTRPEAIKMAPVIKEFKNSKLVDVKICVTAQHRQMLDQVLHLFEIEPDYDLNIMKSNQDLYDITSNVLLSIKGVLKKENPDIVFVQGDTTTTFAASLASFYQKIPVAHIEAGLRTYNIYSPFPEEINRQLTSRIATYHFAPTNRARDNLIKEGIDENKIYVTGNTVIDALLEVVEKIKNKDINIKGYNITDRKYILVTGHRRENFGKRFENVCNALKEIAINNPEIDIVYPVHLNPNVQKPVYEILSNIPNVYLIEPLDYEPFVYLMYNSYIILTDSGGIQEEAPSLGKPVLVTRDTTERPEAVEAGTVKLVGTNREKIVKEVENLLYNKSEYEKMSKATNPYGDGKASLRILDAILKQDRS